MIFHLKKEIHSIFNTLCEEERSEAWLKNYAWPFWPIKIDVCTVRVPSIPAQLLPSIVTHLTAVTCACVCVCVSVYMRCPSNKFTCQVSLHRFFHSQLSHSLSLPSCSAVPLTVICSPTHPPTHSMGQLPSVSYVYLTKNAGMPIKRAQKVVLNMEQVLWFGKHITYIYTVPKRSTLTTSVQHYTILYINLQAFRALFLFDLRPATFLSVPN